VSAEPLPHALLPSPKYSALQTLAFLPGPCTDQTDDGELAGGQSSPLGWPQDTLPPVPTCDRLDCPWEGGTLACEMAL